MMMMMKRWIRGEQHFVETSENLRKIEEDWYNFRKSWKKKKLIFSELRADAPKFL